MSEYKDKVDRIAKRISDDYREGVMLGMGVPYEGPGIDAIFHAIAFALVDTEKALLKLCAEQGEIVMKQMNDATVMMQEILVMIEEEK